MNFSVFENDEHSIIKVEKNKLLGIEAGEFQKLVEEILDKGCKSLVIDLSNVDYVTSWGIGMLVHAYTTSTNFNAKFCLLKLRDSVKDLLVKVKMDTIFEMKDEL